MGTEFSTFPARSDFRASDAAGTYSPGLVAHHVLHSLDGCGVHDPDLGGVLGRDPMFFIFVINDLQLTGVRELDDSPNWHLEFATLRVVQPDMVSLRAGRRERDRDFLRAIRGRGSFKKKNASPPRRELAGGKWGKANLS